MEQQNTQLTDILKQSEAIKSRVKELKEMKYGANWLYRALTNFRKMYPADLLMALCKLANRRNINTHSQNITDLSSIEQLQGLGIFKVDIRETLILNILKPLTQLEASSETEKSELSISNYCKWAGNLDAQFACAEFLINEGHVFFKPDNLLLLKHIPLSEQSTRLTRSLQWDYHGAVVK